MKPNRMLQTIQRIHQHVPKVLQPTALSMAFNLQVKYAGTTGIAIQQLEPHQSVVTLQNKWRIQNHIGSVHATAMATLAESATGMIFGLHVPDTHLPLLKSMNIRYNKRAVGDLKAVASLTPQQQQDISAEDRGSTIVQVQVTDQEGKEPIECEMEWAWTPKKKKEEKK